MEQFLPIANRTATITWIANSFLFSIPFVRKMIMPSDKDEIGPGKLVGITKGLVRKRLALEDPGHARDMMGAFIRFGVNEKDLVYVSLTIV
jgi:hypothetical protein